MKSKEIRFKIGDISYKLKKEPLKVYTNRKYNYFKYKVIQPQKITTSDDIFCLSFENFHSEFFKKDIPYNRRDFSTKRINTTKTGNLFVNFITETYFFELIDNFIEDSKFFFSAATEIRNILKKENINLIEIKAYKRIQNWKEFIELVLFLRKERNIEHLINLIILYSERCLKN